jgi:hypothetical protein
VTLALEIYAGVQGRTGWTLTFLDQGLKAGERVVRLSDFATLAKEMRSRF